MRYFLGLPFLLLIAFSSNASAGWVCASTTLYPTQCAAAANSPTAEQFAVVYLAAFDDSGLYKNYVPGQCIVDYGDRKTCSYTYTHGGNPKSSTFSVIGSDTISCDETLETRGPDSTAIKSGDKYYISWSVSSVTKNICHNSCSYLASSAVVSNCYLNTGSTTSGFCNYFVGVDSSNSSCSVESGYNKPTIGDSLTITTPPPIEGGGDGDGDGEGEGEGDGDGVSNVIVDGGELSFETPTELDTEKYLNEQEGTKRSREFVNKLKSQLDTSQFGISLNDFQQKAESMGSGTCPVASLNMFQTTVVFDSHCTLFLQIIPLLSAVFLAAWSILSIRIVLSA